jgi:hypothetical protein
MISVARLIADEKYQMGSVSRQKLAVLGTMKEIGTHEMPRRVLCKQAQTMTYNMVQKQTF